MSHIPDVTLSGTRLVEDVEVTRASALNGSSQAATLHFEALLDMLYVSSRPNPALGSYIEALPQYIDPLTARYGIDLYDRMMLDSDVQAAEGTITMSVLHKGPKFMPPAHIQQGSPRWTDAVTAADFVNYNVGMISSNFQSVLDQLMMALPYGHKVVEQLYEMEDRKFFPGPKLYLTDLKPKPLTATQFLVDQFSNTLGLVSTNDLNMGDMRLARTSAEGGAQNSLIGLIAGGIDPAHVIPRPKFIIHSNRPRNGDPRGTSNLISAYEHWWAKKQAMVQWAKYLATYARPPMVGMAAPGAGASYETNPDGSPKPVRSAEQRIVDELVKVQDGAVIGIPNGADVKLLMATGANRLFLDAIQHHNSEIALAILYQTLATGEGKFSSRAQSQTHQDVMGILILYHKAALAWTLHMDLCRTLIYYNFGPRFMDVVPTAKLGEVEHQDFARYAAAVAALEQSGYLHPSMKGSTDAILGLDGRDMEATLKEHQQKFDAELKSQTMKQDMQLKSGGKPSAEGARTRRKAEDTTS